MSRPPREVRLSRAGKVFVVFTVAVGFAAVNTGNNILFLLVSLMLAIMILSGLAALLNLWRIDVHVPPGQLLNAGEAAVLQIELRNDRPWGAWLLELQLGPARVSWPYLGARTTVSISLPWTAAERGQPPLPDLLLRFHHQRLPIRAGPDLVRGCWPSRRTTRRSTSFATGW